jgi:outer membrane protein OmpA-like peptidoglycan-associated protein
MRKFVFILMFINPLLRCAYAQSSMGALLFPPTPNPADDKCLVRMYLPEADDKAELRILNKADSIVRIVDLSQVKGIQSSVVVLSDLPKGKYVCQLFYKGLIGQSIIINHSIIENDKYAFDSASINNKMSDLQLKISTLDYNIVFLRDYNLYQDTMLQGQLKAHGNDSLLTRIIVMNREIAHLRLKLESFEQLMRELAILKVRNKLSENPMKKGNKYTLTRIYFNRGSNDFLEKSKGELDDLVSVLNEFPGIVIKINGHTDNVGNYNANLALSKQRAKSVYSYLIEKGIDADRLSYEGYGSNYPFTDNITDEDRAINRRVEFVILK